MHLTNYDNQIMFRDVNVGEDEVNMSHFCSSYHLTNTVKDSTFNKNPENRNSSVTEKIVQFHIFFFISN